MNTPDSRPTAEDEIYSANLRLNRAELDIRRLHLTSMPLYLSVILGTACNIDCAYCYQTKTSENLLTSDPFGIALRRELSAFYPYLSTLRIGGGEVFVISGFEAFVDEISAAVNRPIISISTNGTLINEKWAEKITRIPFQEVTVSIDGALPDTYARLRKGASLESVLGNVDRIQRIKSRNKAAWPDVNFFFLIMRSNYREIPAFLQMARDHGIDQVSFQILLVDERNLCREPGLSAEIDFEEDEVRELHDLTHRAIGEGRKEFRRINISGLHSLFQAHNLETDFLNEGQFSIYPGSDDANVEPAGRDAGEVVKIPSQGAVEPTIRNDIRLCPNPWTLMFVTENGNVHLCFGMPPIGNIYETPLIRLWNSPKAIAARSEIINGNYESAGCSKYWCSWREGKKSNIPESVAIQGLIREFQRLTQQAIRTPNPSSEAPGDASAPETARRMLTERNQRIVELEARFVGLCEKNQAMLDSADKQNQLLAARIADLERVLRMSSENGVPLVGSVRFGSSSLMKIMKKSAIGAAIRLIQLLERSMNLLKRLVNWIGNW